MAPTKGRIGPVARAWHGQDCDSRALLLTLLTGSALSVLLLDAGLFWKPALGMGAGNSPRELGGKVCEPSGRSYSPNTLGAGF